MLALSWLLGLVGYIRRVLAAAGFAKSTRLVVFVVCRQYWSLDLLAAAFLLLSYFKLAKAAELEVMN